MGSHVPPKSSCGSVGLVEVYMLPTGQLNNLINLTTVAVYYTKFIMKPSSIHLQFVLAAELYRFSRIWGWNGKHQS